MVTQAATPPTLPAVRIALFSTAAGFMGGAVMLVYGLAWVRHDWPPAHPSGAFWVSSCVVLAYYSAFCRRRSLPFMVGLGVAVALAIAFTAFWTFGVVDSLAEVR